MEVSPDSSCTVVDERNDGPQFPTLNPETFPSDGSPENADSLFQNLAGPLGAKRWPERILTDWRRFSCGLWRIPEGDIAGAYCADTFPRLKAFSEGGQLFTNCGACYRSLLVEANCYPLLALDGSPLPKERPFSYEGLVGSYQRREVILGPKVIFASLEPTIEEWRTHLQVQYADGGCFADHKNYGDYLAYVSPVPSENEQLAVNEEMAGIRSGYSKREMQKYLENEPNPNLSRHTSQMTLF